MTRALTPLRLAAAHAMRAVVTAQVLACATQAWLMAQDDKARNDRGSDSTEKAIMILAAIAIAGFVTIAVKAYISKKTEEIGKQP